MLFNSLEFVAFFALFFPLYWVIGRRRNLQNAFVLLGSYVFYGWWDWRFLGLIAASSLVDFGVGIAIENASERSRKRRWLAVSLVFNLGLLLFFKYFNFFADNFQRVLESMGMHADPFTLNVILPVGISFYTFQTLSYSLDVYRGDIRASREPLAFFAYVAFFPQLVAGPIERASRLLPQFLQNRSFDMVKAKDGMRQILWGLFTKIVIADNCAPLVNQIFEADPSSLGGTTLATGAILFAFQIYGDFAGYSNIALGLSKLLGFELMVNFRTPYFSRDMAEFWRRWHISLSTWFRDYLYIPLGGSKAGRWKSIRNVFIIFLVSGFWHGANWTFVAWGGLNALFFLPLFIGGKNRRFTEHVAEGRWLPSWGEGWRMGLTFVLTCLAWVFFRAESMSGALAYLSASLQNITYAPGAMMEFVLNPVTFFVVVLLALEWVHRTRDHGLDIARWPWLIRWGAYYVVLFSIFFFGNYHTPVDFIYFQF